MNMAQTSVQYTPVQVLQAARRAEAEGKMDYALQFYRHIVEHHGSSAEAQEAREGLFRIAEWRWGEARIARRQEAGGYTGQPHAVGGGHAETGHTYAPETPDASVPPTAGPTRMPQIIAREAGRAAAEAEALSAQKPRYRVGKVAAWMVSGCGWVSVLGGIVAAVLALGGGVAEISSVVLLGLPLGVALGVPAAVMGLVLVVTGYLAIAVFESSNATLDLAEARRRR